MDKEKEREEKISGENTEKLVTFNVEPNFSQLIPNHNSIYHSIVFPPDSIISKTN